jgi:hypothetical protein
MTPDPKTVELCAKIAEDYEGSASAERADNPGGAACQEIAERIRGLLTSPQGEG